MLFPSFLSNRPVRSLAAPLDEGEALSDEGRQLLLWDGDRGIQGPVGHEDAQDAIGPRRDSQGDGVGIVLSLEGDEVPGVVLPGDDARIS